MPHRLIEHLEGARMLALMMLTGIASALAAALPIESGTLMNDVQLRMVCVAGALAGGIASLRIFKLRRPKIYQSALDNLSDMAGKVFTATAISVIFTPIFMRWQHLPLDVDWVLGVSGAFALFNRLIIRLASMGIERWAKRFMPRDENDPPKQ